MILDGWGNNNRCIYESSKLPICSILDFPVSDSYRGYCRFGYETEDKKDLIRELKTLNAKQCYKKCQRTKDCVAFAYQDNDAGKNCYLYRGGPYTHGKCRGAYHIVKGEDTTCYKDTTCYIVSSGKFNRFLFMLTVAKLYTNILNSKNIPFVDCYLN